MKKLVILAVANTAALLLAGVFYTSAVTKAHAPRPAAHHTVIVTFGTKV